MPNARGPLHASPRVGTTLALPTKPAALPFTDHHPTSVWLRSPLSVWMDRTILYFGGYILQFCCQSPPFCCVLQNSLSTPRERAALEEEIAALLEKGVVWAVPSSEEWTGFIYLYFLVPKKSGGMRSV